MRIRIPFGVSAAALAACLGGCGDVSGPAPVPGTTAGAAAAAPAREATALAAVRHPIDLYVEGESRIIGWCDESAGSALVLVTGAGTMPHLGRFRTEQTACNSFVTGAITDGEAVSFAANGDELHMTWFGRVVPGVEPQTLELTYLIYGGTGRFAHAEGEIDFVVVYSSETDWTAQGSGSLQYEASDRGR